MRALSTQVPAFAKRLRGAMGNSPRCLEFAILTAARTSEAPTAQWTEFDRQAQTWTIPAAFAMKARGRCSGRLLTPTASGLVSLLR